MLRKLVIIKTCDHGTVQQRVVHYCTSRIEFVMMLAEEEIFKLRFRNIGFFLKFHSDLINKKSGRHMRTMYVSLKCYCIWKPVVSLNKNLDCLVLVDTQE